MARKFRNKPDETINKSQFYYAKTDLVGVHGAGGFV